MEPILDVLQKNMQTELTSNTCDQHPYRSSKPVYKIMIDGQEVCPLCETQNSTAELEKQTAENIKTSLKQKDYTAFEKQSILTDTGLLNASFGTYEADSPETIENKERATKAFLKYKEGVLFTTWFTGNPGVGKSHLAMSILRNLNETGEKDKRCIFASVDEMLLRIRASFDDKESPYTEHYFVDLLSNADYLVLDDLGAETGGTGTNKKATDFTLRVLYAIANGRQNKPTIVTTNLTREALVRMYDPKLVSRLMKNTYQIKFESAEDKRIQKIEF